MTSPRLASPKGGRVKKKTKKKAGIGPWTERASTPHKFNSNIVLLDNDSFIVAPYNYKPQKSMGISVYDPIKDKWSTFIDWGNDHLTTSYHSMYLDTTTSLLHLFGTEGNFITLNMNKYKLQSTQNYSTLVTLGRKPAIYNFKNKLHFLCGSASVHDYTYSFKQSSDNPFKLQHSFKSLKGGLSGHAVVHIPDTINGAGTLYMLGGYDGGRKKSNKSFFRCSDPKKCKWEAMQSPQLPRPMAAFGYVVTHDHRYVLLFGGRSGAGFTNSILVWNVALMKVRESSVKTATAGIFNAVLKRNNDVHLINLENGKHYSIPLEAILGDKVVLDDEKEAELVARYDEEVVKQLVTLQLGSRAECIRASELVVDYKDINTVAEKLREVVDVANPRGKKEVGSMRSFVGAIGELLGMIQKKIDFMDTHNGVVDALIGMASQANQELLRKAKAQALDTEKEIANHIMNISAMNEFLNNIVLIENLFNGLYDSNLREEQRAARLEFAESMVGFEEKAKPKSEVKSFVALVFAGTSLEIGAFGKWLKHVENVCMEEGVKVLSSSGAKAKNIARSFYKAFYVYGSKDDVKTGATGFREMTDILRCSFVFDNFKDLYRCFSVIERVSKENGGAGILRCKDRFHPEHVPFGYRDLLLNVYCPGSKMVCEIQLQHEVFYKYKKISHVMYKKARLFEQNDVNLAYAYADTHMRKVVGDNVYAVQDEDEEDDEDEGAGEEEKNLEAMDAKVVLQEWGLEAYIDGFVEDGGYDDVSMWQDVTEDELIECGFKKGHSKKFTKKVAQLFGT